MCPKQHIGRCVPLNPENYYALKSIRTFSTIPCNKSSPFKNLESTTVHLKSTIQVRCYIIYGSYCVYVNIFGSSVSNKLGLLLAIFVLLAFAAKERES